jgi:flagellar hook assembly protein FlgD
VATVFHGALPAGERTFRWDGRDAAGRAAAPGAYRARLSAAGVREARAFALVR